MISSGENNHEESVPIPLAEMRIMISYEFIPEII